MSRGKRKTTPKRKKPQQDLVNWGKQEWTTKSGEPSSKTGERYLPKAAIKALTPAEYAATTRAKREGTKQGKQFVDQPKAIAKKTSQFRQAKTGGKINKRKYGKAPHNRIY